MSYISVTNFIEFIQNREPNFERNGLSRADLYKYATETLGATEKDIRLFLGRPAPKENSRNRIRDVEKTLEKVVLNLGISLEEVNYYFIHDGPIVIGLGIEKCGKVFVIKKFREMEEEEFQVEECDKIISDFKFVCDVFDMDQSVTIVEESSVHIYKKEDGNLSIILEKVLTLHPGKECSFGYVVVLSKQNEKKVIGESELMAQFRHKL